MTTQPTQEAPSSDVVEAIIKPLKWLEPHASVSYPNWHAQVSAIKFSARIDTSRASMFGKFPLSINDWTPDERFDSLEDAKAFAEQYYRNRVLELLDLSALASTAGDTLKAENEALRAALEKCREHVRRAHAMLEETEFADNEVIGGIFARAINHIAIDARTALGSDQ